MKGKGNSISYKYRMHDPRIGRFFAIDPLASTYPHNSPYAFSENRVIDGVELEVMTIHSDARVSAFVTVSVSSGIIFDIEGNVGLFYTYGSGGGFCFGASAGGGVSVYPFADITKLAGPRASYFIGGNFTGGAEFSLETPMTNSVWANSGITGTIGVGEGVHIGSELTNTDMFLTTWSEVGNVLWETIKDLNGFLSFMGDAKESLESSSTKMGNLIKGKEKELRKLVSSEYSITDHYGVMDLAEEIFQLQDQKEQTDNVIQELDSAKEDLKTKIDSK